MPADGRRGVRRARWLAGISLTVALAWSLPLVAQATTPPQRGGVAPGADRLYKGKTSQGVGIQIFTSGVKRASVMTFW